MAKKSKVFNKIKVFEGTSSCSQVVSYIFFQLLLALSISNALINLTDRLDIHSAFGTFKLLADNCTKQLYK